MNHQPQPIAELRRQLAQRWGAAILPDPAELVSAAWRGRDTGEHTAPWAIPTGFHTLDRALGTGGLPRGRVVELCGAWSSGKTSLAFRLLAQLLHGDGLAAYVDLAGQFHPPSAAATGVFLPALLLLRPRSALQALEATATLLRSDGFDLIIHDLGTSATTPDTSTMARLASLASKSRVLLLFLTTPDAHRRAFWSETSDRPSPIGFFSTMRLRIVRSDGFWYGPDDVLPSYTSPTPSDAPGRDTPATRLSEGGGDGAPDPPGRTPSPPHLAGPPAQSRAFPLGAPPPPGVALTFPPWMSSVRPPRIELAGYRLAVTVVKNKLGPYGMTVDLALSPWRQPPAAVDEEEHGRHEDRLPLDPALHALDGVSTLPGAPGTAAGDRRRAV